MVAVLMMSAKLATLGLLKIKVFWNKGYEVISMGFEGNIFPWSHQQNFIMSFKL